MERCKAKLCSWKRSTLSKAGKLTLAKSVLASIPIYMLSLFTAPPKVIKSIEKVIRDFLWDPSERKKGHHYVAWDTCHTPLRKGGLGIKSLKSMNKILLPKWWWRFNKEKTAYWRKAIIAKYGSCNFDKETKKPKDPNVCGVWKGIYSQLILVLLSLLVTEIPSDFGKKNGWENSLLRQSSEAYMQFLSQKTGQ